MKHDNILPMLTSITTAVTTSSKLCKNIESKILIGISWKIISCICFAGINLIIRYLSRNKIHAGQNLPNLVIMFFQHAIGAAILIPFWLKEDKTMPKFSCRVGLGLHLVRITIAITGMLLWYISLNKMPVTEVVAISFIAPILTLVGAIFVLKESLTLKKSLAILLSLIGGFFISRPDLAITTKTSTWNAIFPLSAALFFALDKIITRKILTIDPCPKLITIYLLLFTSPICLGLIVLTNSWITPNLVNFITLVVLGALSALANFSFTKALASTEIAITMPYGISKIVFTSILSYIFLNEIPQSANLWIGIIVISLSTILIM